MLTIHFELFRAKMENHENTFWKSNMKTVPGRPSPKRDFKPLATRPKNPGASTSSFEVYQESVSDAWALSDDELTKEYAILSPDSKILPRRIQQRSFNKNPQIPVVHKATTSPITNVTNTTSVASSRNIPAVIEPPLENDQHHVESNKEYKKTSLSTIHERSNIEYG